jgi:hypothetical protein
VNRTISKVSRNGEAKKGIFEEVQPVARMADAGFVHNLGSLRLRYLEPRNCQWTDWRSIQSPLFSEPPHDFDPAHIDVALDSHLDCTQVDPHSMGYTGGQTSGCFFAPSGRLRVDSDGVDAISSDMTRLRNMRKILEIVSLALLLVFAPTTLLPAQKTAIDIQTFGALNIYGSVNSPLNLTYAELLSFPMVSEVAELKCVSGPPDVIYNWTGVPLFYLLTLAQIRPEAYKIVTRCSDGFYTDLLVEDALKPTTILALQANGTSLPQLAYGPASPYRLIVPGKWGYKWASGIQEIEVVTTDERGLWESSGYSDEAIVPNYGPMPTPTPPLQTFSLSYGNRTFEIDAYTNASVNALVFDYFQRALNINVTVPEGTYGFAVFILKQDFLRGPYNVTLDGKTINATEGDTTTLSYLLVSLDGGFHAMTILGTEFFGYIPQIMVDYNATTYLGQNTTFDASESFDYGGIISYEWSFGDGKNTSGPVVFHLYAEVGLYQVKLNVTNIEGISSFETLTVTVENPPVYISLPLKVFFVVALTLLVLMLAILLRNRRK